MKWKMNFDVTLPTTVDPFDATDKLKEVYGVLSANVINAEEINIKFDNRKTDEATLRSLATDNRAA